MKILFADKFPQAYFDELTIMGHQCELQSELTAQTLPEHIEDYEILVVRSTKVTSQTLEKGSALKAVIRAGAGTNTIEKTFAREKSIDVCNVPGKNALAVAELTMGLLMAIDRKIVDNVISLRSGIWNKKRFSQAQGLYGRHLGLLGIGAIGMAVCERARAFGINVSVLKKPNRDESIAKKILDLGIGEVDDQKTMLSKCDIISIHLPANEQTKGMVNDDFLSQMQQGAILLNTSRGELIDEQALLKAMNEKNIFAGLDVYQNEPATGEAEFSSEITKHANVYGTHHIGASTSQAQDAVAQGVIEVITAVENGDIINCVN